MIDKERPEIVSVTASSWARAGADYFCRRARGSGINAEKGLCASLAEADRVVAACRGEQRRFQLGYVAPEHDGFKRLRRRSPVAISASRARW